MSRELTNNPRLQIFLPPDLQSSGASPASKDFLKSKCQVFSQLHGRISSKSYSVFHLVLRLTYFFSSLCTNLIEYPCPARQPPLSCLPSSFHQFSILLSPNFASLFPIALPKTSALSPKSILQILPTPLSYRFLHHPSLYHISSTIKRTALTQTIMAKYSAFFFPSSALPLPRLSKRQI